MAAKFITRVFQFLTMFLITLTCTVAQTSQDFSYTQKLYIEIAQADSILFDAFNEHDLSKFRLLFTDDLEFYHDLGGFSLYKQTMESFDALFKQNNGMRRELVKGSLEIYPIKNYGAIETGVHIFSHIENGRQIQGTFKFVHIWKNETGQWKISRVISYGH